MDRYRNVCVWLIVPSLGTIGYHCKELPVSKAWNSRLRTWEPQVPITKNFRFPKLGTPGSQPGNHSLPLQRTSGSQMLKLTAANMGTTDYHCKQLPVSRGRELLVPNLGTRDYHCKCWNWYIIPCVGTKGKELPLPRAWNSRFPTWEPDVTIARNFRFSKVRWFHTWKIFTLPVEG